MRPDPSSRVYSPLFSPSGSETIGGLRGLASVRTSSVNAVMGALKQTLQGIDYDLGSIQAQMQSHMQAADFTRRELNFLREVSSRVSSEGILDATSCPAATFRDIAERHGIDLSLEENRRLLTTCARQANGSLMSGHDGQSRAILESAVQQVQGRLDSISNLLQNDGRTLQALMNHRGESMNTISQLLNSEHESNMAAIRNIK